MKNQKQINKKAIVLAHFGTTYPKALASLDNIKKMIQNSFPQIPIKTSFTSNIVRGIWKKRQLEPDKWLAQGVPQDILYVRGLLATIGDLQDQGYRTIVVQPTHVFHGEQFADLNSYIEGLQSIKTVKKVWMPFEKIVLSRPTLGTYGVQHDYRDDIRETVKALAPDYEMARTKKASLIYVGHGNKYYSTGAFLETRKFLEAEYPDVKTHIGMVEGYPALEDIIKILKEDNFFHNHKKILLKPFMITAGDHTHRDINGDSEESWRSRLISCGFDVEVVMEGLGSNHSIAKIFAKRISETAMEHHIDLSSKEM